MFEKFLCTGFTGSKMDSQIKLLNHDFHSFHSVWLPNHWQDWQFSRSHAQLCSLYNQQIKELLLLSRKQNSPNQPVIQCCYRRVHLMSVTYGGVTTVLQEIVVQQLSRYFCFPFSFYLLLLLGLHSYSAVHKQSQAIFGMNGALGSDRHGKMF